MQHARSSFLLRQDRGFGDYYSKGSRASFTF